MLFLLLPLFKLFAEVWEELPEPASGQLSNVTV
jgi:hypothetical protein